MGIYITNPTSIAITSGQTDSTILDTHDADSIVVYAPAALTGECAIYVSPAATGGTFVPLYVDGAVVAVVQGTGTAVVNYGFKQLRVISDSAEGGTRTFPIAVVLSKG